MGDELRTNSDSAEVGLRYAHLESRPKVLLICPKFFSYQEQISAAISSLGLDLVCWNDRPLQSTLYKSMLRLFPKPVGDLSAGNFIRRARDIPPDSLAHVLVVKGEALSPQLLKALRSRFPSARFSLYLWDNVDNAHNGRRIAPLFDAVSTFDPNDSATMGWTYRPLFSLLPESRRSHQEVLYDWSFIGTIHSDRAKVLARIDAAIGPSRRGFVCGYFPSRLLYAMQWLRSATVRDAPSGHFTLQPMPFFEMERVVQRSRATVDIEHPRQAGLTTRCFDAVLSGRKLITTNQFILETGLYHPSRVCVVDRNNPEIPMDFLVTPINPVSDALRYAYSRDSWLRHVLGLPQKLDIVGY